MTLRRTMARPRLLLQLSLALLAAALSSYGDETAAGQEPAANAALLAKAGSAEDKLKTIILPKVPFRDASIKEVVQYLQERSKALDPANEGVDIQLKLVPPAEGEEDGRTFSMEFHDMPLVDVVRYLCLAGGLKYRVEGNTIVIADRSIPINPIETQAFDIDRATLLALCGALEPDALRKTFAQLGLSFPEGSSIRYDAQAAKLLLTNLPADLHRAEQLVAALAPKDPVPTPTPGTPETPDPLARINKTLDIILPTLSFQDAPISSAIRHLRDRAKALDPEKKGLNIILILEVPDAPDLKKEDAPDGDEDGGFDEGGDEFDEFGEDADEAPAEEPEVFRGRTITMEFSNIPLGTVIRYTCKGSGLVYRVEPNAVIIADPSIRLDPVETRDFAVDRHLIQTLCPTEAGGADRGPPQEDLMEALEEMGVSFPEAACRARYVPSLGKLIVSTTTRDLRRAEEFLAGEIAMSPGEKAMLAKLEAIKLPRLSFKNTSIFTAVQHLRDRGLELDPQKRGVNIFLLAMPPQALAAEENGEAEGLEGRWLRPEELPGAETYRQMTMEFADIPFGDAIRHVCEAAGLDFHITSSTVIIMEPSMPFGPMTHHAYAIDKAAMLALSTPSTAKGEGKPDVDPLGRQGLRRSLIRLGVRFPDDAKIRYFPRAGKLVAINTPANLRRIAAIIAGKRDE